MPEPSSARGRTTAPRFGLKAFIVFAAILAICFARPLFELVMFAVKGRQSELYSYILLIPFISGYLIKTSGARLDLIGRPGVGMGVVSVVVGAGILTVYHFEAARGWSPERSDYLALMTLSFLMFLLGGGFFFLGAKYLRTVAFPVAFAFFSVPLPGSARLWIEGILQHGSADIATMMLQLSGMPVFQQDTRLQLPGFHLEVAPECSGIHSSLILFITSLLAGYIFFKSNWRRLTLAVAVIPLAFLRNGFRVFAIGQLCVRISPAMIDSPIHRHGGPIFFALSIIPLLLLVVFLRKGELRKHP